MLVEKIDPPDYEHSSERYAGKAEKPQRPRIAFYTLGCKVNQSETDALADQFMQRGFVCVPYENQADVYVVNTCTVTHVADAKSRQILRQARVTNPAALVVATGCYASIVRDELPVANVLVVRNRDKHRLPEIVSRHVSVFPDPGFNDKPVVLGFGGEHPYSPRTRPMVKIQDGCDSACAYCIIPRARGRSRSTEPTTVVQRVKCLVAEGHKEVVITGVDLGSYGEDNTDIPDLAGIVRLLLESTDVHRIRISSVEPGDFNVSWLSLWEDQRLCRHLHVPLQAGTDGVLANMRRKYNTHQFRSMIETCRDSIPGVAITTDVITGFPGETDADFEEGRIFIEECKFDGMHVFPYSRRPGTWAARMPNDVSDAVKKSRGAILREIGKAGQSAHVQRCLGATLEVIWESHREGVWRGITDNNIRVFSTDEELSPNHVDTRILTTRYADGCWGEPECLATRNEIALIAI